MVFQANLILFHEKFKNNKKNTRIRLSRNEGATIRWSIENSNQMRHQFHLLYLYRTHTKTQKVYKIVFRTILVQVKK